MRVYLDTSCLAPLVAPGAFNTDIGKIVTRAAAADHTLMTSDRALLETVAVLAIKTRTRDMTPARAQDALRDLEQSQAGRDPATLEKDDVRYSTELLRGFDKNLRAPDALHLAIVRRLGATLATFDVGMAAAARGLGIEVLD